MHEGADNGAGSMKAPMMAMLTTTSWTLAISKSAAPPAAKLATRTHSTAQCHAGEDVPLPAARSPAKPGEYGQGRGKRGTRSAPRGVWAQKADEDLKELFKQEVKKVRKEAREEDIDKWMAALDAPKEEEATTERVEPPASVPKLPSVIADEATERVERPSQPPASVPKLPSVIVDDTTERIERPSQPPLSVPKLPLVIVDETTVKIERPVSLPPSKAEPQEGAWKRMWKERPVAILATVLCVLLGAATVVLAEFLKVDDKAKVPPTPVPVPVAEPTTTGVDLPLAPKETGLPKARESPPNEGATKVQSEEATPAGTVGEKPGNATGLQVETAEKPAVPAVPKKPKAKPAAPQGVTATIRDVAPPPPVVPQGVPSQVVQPKTVPPAATTTPAPAKTVPEKSDGLLINP